MSVGRAHSRRQQKIGLWRETDVDANVRPDARPLKTSSGRRAKRQRGTYQVYVQHYKKHQKRKSKDPTRFEVIIQTPSALEVFNGAISEGDPILQVYEFELHELSERTPPDEYRVLRNGGAFSELEEMVNPIMRWLAEEHFSLITVDGIEFSLAWKKR